MTKQLIPGVEHQTNEGMVRPRIIRDAPDKEETKETKRKVAPLVRTLNECANETVDDQEPGEEEDSEDLGRCHGCKRQKREKHQGSVDEPLYISHILEGCMSMTAVQQRRGRTQT